MHVPYSTNFILYHLGPQGGAMDYEVLIDRLIAEDDQKFARPLRCTSVCNE